MEHITKTAMITVCGRPNVGKSSLTNALVGEKIAIVSDKPQTTRNRIYGVVNRGDTQYVLLDTPGLHKPCSRLGDYMVKVVRESLSSVECALLLVEPIAHVGEPERILLQRIREENLPCVLCINKIDTVEKKDALLEVIAAYSEAYDGFDAIIPISARTGDGLDDLLAQLARYTYQTGNFFEPGAYIPGDGSSLHPELNSAITGLAIVSDTTVAPIETVHGKVAFLQLVGLTQPELDALARDPDALDSILERMRADDPELVLDMRRTKSYV